jgi:hypothetical protein
MKMSRETKAGLVVSGAFVCLVGTVLLSKMREPTRTADKPTEEPVQVAQNTPAEKPQDPPANNGGASLEPAAPPVNIEPTKPLSVPDAGLTGGVQQASTGAMLIPLPPDEPSADTKGASEKDTGKPRRAEKEVPAASGEKNSDGAGGPLPPPLSTTPPVEKGPADAGTKNQAGPPPPLGAPLPPPSVELPPPSVGLPPSGPPPLVTPIDGKPAEPVSLNSTLPPLSGPGSNKDDNDPLDPAKFVGPLPAPDEKHVKSVGEEKKTEGRAPSIKDVKVGDEVLPPPLGLQIGTPPPLASNPKEESKKGDALPPPTGGPGDVLPPPAPLGIGAATPVKPEPAAAPLPPLGGPAPFGPKGETVKNREPVKSGDGRDAVKSGGGAEPPLSSGVNLGKPTADKTDPPHAQFTPSATLQPLEPMPLEPVGNSGVSRVSTNDRQPMATLPPQEKSSPAPAGGSFTGVAPPIKLPDMRSAQPLASAKPQVVSYDERTLTLAAGDTYESLSLTYYNTKDYAQALQTWNQSHPRTSAALHQDGRLTPGDRIFLPPAEILQKNYPEAIPDKRPQSRGPARTTTTTASLGTPDKSARYTVTRDESLSTIARFLTGDSSRADELAKLNPGYRSTDRVVAGTQLVLPPGVTPPAESAPH